MKQVKRNQKQSRKAQDKQKTIERRKQRAAKEQWWENQ
jgi:hypothetical protein